MSIIKLEIEEGDDRREAANILMCNGYKVWFSRKCTIDMGGMAGSQYTNYLFAEKMPEESNVKRR